MDALRWVALSGAFLLRPTAPEDDFDGGARLGWAPP
jgi:hypothetical protein